mgnify:CR=1 FL=1|tara:strand:- start:5854 stop:6591 length:738 start_codon:yes stop_codon:yes gene_type:complete
MTSTALTRLIWPIALVLAQYNQSIASENSAHRKVYKNGISVLVPDSPVSEDGTLVYITNSNEKNTKREVYPCSNQTITPDKWVGSFYFCFGVVRPNTSDQQSALAILVEKRNSAEGTQYGNSVFLTQNVYPRGQGITQYSRKGYNSYHQHNATRKDLTTRFHFKLNNSNPTYHVNNLEALDFSDNAIKDKQRRLRSYLLRYKYSTAGSWIPFTVGADDAFDTIVIKVVDLWDEGKVVQRCTLKRP